MYDDGTNIGIGAINPTYKLDVSASSNSDGIRIQNAGASRFIFNGDGVAYWGGASANGGQLTWDTGKAIVMGQSGYALSLGSNGTWDRMYINTSGNVGIGTTNPDFNLTINGITGIQSSGTTKYHFAYYTGGLNFAETGIADYRLFIKDGGNVGIGTGSPAQKLDVYGSIHVQSSSTVGTIYFGNTNQNYISYSDSDSYYRANGAHYFEGSGFYKGIWNADGNLGVGTTSVSGNSTNRVVSIVGADSANLILTETGGASAAFTSYANEAYIGTATNHPFYLYTSGSERMRIGTNGSMKFNAYGSGTFTGTVAYNLAVDSSGNIIESAGGVVDGSGTANYVTKWQDANTVTNSVMYDDGTNVGIGTSSPTTPLEVVGASRFNHASGTGQTNISTFINSTNNAYASITAAGVSSVVPSWINGSMIMEFVPYSTGNAIFSAYSGDITFQTNARTEYMRITSAGNVGINTVTPAYKLSVVGKIALNDGGNSVFIGDNAGLSDDATANLNVAIGTSALQNNVVGASNVAVGNLALNTNLGSTNTALGANALQLNTTGVSNTAVGASSQLNSGVGTFNTSVGTNTLLFLASGSSNAAFGSSALRNVTSGSTNAALGTSALFTLTSGDSNTAVGTNAISNNTTGSENTALGRNAGRYFSTGTSANTNASGSIFIGFNSRANAVGQTNQIVIGNEALGLGSNTVVLGNDNVTTTALKGNGGIGTTSPSQKLDVVGSIKAGIAGNSSANIPALLVTSTGTATTQAAIAIQQTFTEGDTLIFADYDQYTEWNFMHKNDVNQFIVHGGVSTNGLGTNTFYSPNGSARTGYIKHVFDQTNGNFYVGGNVGIGTVSPSEKLSVVGNIYANGGFIGYRIDGGTGLDVNGGDLGSGTYIARFKNYSNVDQFVIKGNGNVGIGTTSPSYLLDVNGTARVTTLIETSALKYKTNIQPLEPQLSKVTQLEPVTFDWLDKPQTKTNIGLIADEVEKIYPEFVSKTEDGEIEGIEYSKLTTVLIQSIKELKEIVDQQQAQINKLLNK